MIVFLVGLFIGVFLGMVMCGLCVASRDEKEIHEELKRRYKEK